MLKIRTSVVVLLLSLGMHGAGAAGCGTKRNEAQRNVNQSGNNNTIAQPTPGRVEESVSDEIKVLAEGAYGKIEDAFVAVVRDAETYAALRELVENLPPVSADFFETQMVVAAFLGQRRTGGYSVQLTRTADNRLRVSSTPPPAGTLTAQVLTAPFKIVSIAVNDKRPQAIELDSTWNNEMRAYRVTSGEFRTGGGFAGRFENLQLAGAIRVGHLGKLATFVFDLKSAGGAKARLLQDAATGIVGTGGQISGAVVDAGTLVDFPRSALSIKGSFAETENKLSLSFESLPSNIADGYGGQGKLEAAATAAPLPVKKPSSDDEPM